MFAVKVKPTCSNCVFSMRSHPVDSKRHGILVCNVHIVIPTIFSSMYSIVSDCSVYFVHRVLMVIETWGSLLMSDLGQRLPPLVESS